MENTFNIIGIVGVIGLVALIVYNALRHEVRVSEGKHALLFRYGKFVRELESGRTVVFGNGFTHTLVDVRPQAFLVANQEVVNAEGVPIRLSTIVKSQVVDAFVYSFASTNAPSDVYQAVQIAVRKAVLELSTEDVVAQRFAISDRVMAELGEKALAVGVKILEVSVRDVVLGGDLKRAMAEKLMAHFEARASLERARGEAATMRSLANSAAMFEKNPGLAQMRLLQAIEGGKATVVIGADTAIAKLGK